MSLREGGKGREGKRRGGDTTAEEAGTTREKRDDKVRQRWQRGRDEIQEKSERGRRKELTSDFVGRVGTTGAKRRLGACKGGRKKRRTQARWGEENSARRGRAGGREEKIKGKK